MQLQRQVECSNVPSVVARSRVLLHLAHIAVKHTVSLAPALAPAAARRAVLRAAALLARAAQAPILLGVRPVAARRDAPAAHGLAPPALALPRGRVGVAARRPSGEARPGRARLAPQRRGRGAVRADARSLARVGRLGATVV